MEKSEAMALFQTLGKAMNGMYGRAGAQTETNVSWQHRRRSDEWQFFDAASTIARLYFNEYNTEADMSKKVQELRREFGGPFVEGLEVAYAVATCEPERVTSGADVTFTFTDPDRETIETDTFTFVE